MSTQLDRIARKAKSEPKLRFTSLAHLLTPEFLTETWKQINRRGASGVDGETSSDGMTASSECNLWSPLREIRTAGCASSEGWHVQWGSNLSPTEVRVRDLVAR